MSRLRPILRGAKKTAMLLAAAYVVWSLFATRSPPASDRTRPFAKGIDLVIDGELISDAKIWDAAKAEGRLMIYGTPPTELMHPVLEGFEKDTGIKTEYLRLASTQMFTRVTTEFSAGKLNADYVDLNELPRAQELVKIGVLKSPYRVRQFALLPESTREPDGNWYQFMRPVTGIAVNTALVKPADEPRTWTDLLDPKWKGKIGLYSIEAGGSTFFAYALLRQKYGLEYWQRLAVLRPRIYPTEPPAITDLVRGETSLIIGGPLQVLPQIRSGAPLKFIFPTDMVPAFGVWGGRSSTALHPNAAALYLDWLTSRRGGNRISAIGAYALHPDASAPNVAGTVFPPASTLSSLGDEEQATLRKPYTEDWKQIFAVQ